MTRSRKKEALQNRQALEPETDVVYPEIYTAKNSISDIPRSLRGYYAKRPRYLLIKQDFIEDGWFSVTPELIAKHTAQVLKCDYIVDAFCGIGGNAIQFSKTCKKVLAIDNNPLRLQIAKHNAEMYGCTNIEFMLGDAVQVLRGVKADVVFLSPPWGGPSYIKTPIFDIESMPLPATLLFETSKLAAERVCMYMPKNSCLEQMDQLEAGAKFEYVWLNGGCKALCGYYGENSE